MRQCTVFKYALPIGVRVSVCGCVGVGVCLSKNFLLTHIYSSYTIVKPRHYGK